MQLKISIARAACVDRPCVLPVPGCSGEDVDGPQLQNMLYLHSHLSRI